MENADNEEKLNNKVIIHGKYEQFPFWWGKPRFCTFVGESGFLLQILDDACKQMAALILVGKIMFACQV